VPSPTPAPSHADAPGWRLASAGPRWGLRFLAAVYRVLPLALGQYLVWGMIWGWFQHYNRPRVSVIRAMARMGQSSPYWAAYRVFLTYGFMLVERFYTYSGRITLTIERSDADARRSAAVMERATKEPGPLVVLSSHCGAVEHTAFVMEGLGRNLRAVAIRDEAAATLLSGVGDPSVALGRGRTIVADGSMKAGLTMLKALKQGDILAFKADRPLPGAGADEILEVPFFGETARFPLGPAKLIAAAKARAVVISVFRIGRATYRAIAHDLDTSSRDPETIVREYVRIQEDHLRHHPDQWFNFYPWWPADEEPVNATPETVPPPLRAAEPSFVATLAAILSLPLLGYLAGVEEVSAVVRGVPSIAAALLLASAAAALAIWRGASVDDKLRYNGEAISTAVGVALIGPAIVAAAAPGSLERALVSMTLGAACFGGLTAWLHWRSRLVGAWLLILLAVISWTM
jgi:predicted LPLAT superfamily acyltransferase